MMKKILALATLGAFLHFTFGCAIYSTKQEKVGAVMGKSLKVLGVLKTSGEYIEFTKKRPGYIVGDKIVRPGTKAKTLEISIADIQARKESQGKIYEIVTKDNKRYEVQEMISEDKDKIVFTTRESQETIPLSEVEMVRVRKLNTGRTILVTAGAVVVGLVLAVLIAWEEPFYPTPPPGESCPFIYSFDGEDYVFDAEPYGGSICQGLKRSEWCGLEHVKEINGQYKILATNELDETQHTDELKLVVIDHPQGIRVAPDDAGRIHTIANPQTPLQAHDSAGRDLLPSLSSKDMTFWQSNYGDKAINKNEGLKDELILEFPKPKDAKRAKLLVNGGTRLWGSQVAKKFLSLYGNQLPQWYEEVNSFGPAFFRVTSWYANEEIYLLKIRVETPEGWKTKGTIYGNGPFITDDRAYVLDVSDIPGETLRLKLTPPVNFWRFDYLAIDYTDDLPLPVTELAPIKALDSKGRDVREALSLADNNSFVMPKTGDFAEVTFAASAKTAGMERSIILKATGFYDIHLKTGGDPQQEILNRMNSEPGFTLRFAYQEYLKGKKEQEKKKEISR